MDNIGKVFSLLPLKLKDEILRLASFRGSSGEGVSEIRIRAFGVSSIVIFGERVELSHTVEKGEIENVVATLCEGSLYAFRDGIKDGYIAIDGGIRVGVCGQARYDGGKLMGISEITSLVFRIPTRTVSEPELLYGAWRECSRGMLIYSPPGVGKTTALRALASFIGSGKCGLQVAVVDERCEFRPDDYRRASVDILRGYKRSCGVEIALRTLSPEVIIVDEIGRAEEAEAMLESLNSGVRLIASAHASSLVELKRRTSVKPFLECGIFDVFVGIFLFNGKRSFVVEREEC